MQEVYFFFDDSGVFHKNSPTPFFIYAGYVFTSREKLDDAKRKYINANKKLRISLGRKDELKASTLTPKNKRCLLNSVKECESIAAVVDLSRIYNHILSDKKSICRYKDYIIKRVIKNKLKNLITRGEISKDKDIRIHIYIDEQLTATNGYYDLRDSIKEELQYGIVGFNYGIHHPNVFERDVLVEIQYCDSSRNYMIQACDILANRIWTSYSMNNPQLRRIDNNTILTFP